MVVFRDSQNPMIGVFRVDVGHTEYACFWRYFEIDA